MAEIRPIRTESDYKAALTRSTSLWMRSSAALRVGNLMFW